MTFVIFDTEYTSWQGCQEYGWRDWQKREIVQIAALKVDENLNVIDQLCIYCRPSVNPVLSDYFVNLTGISNDIIKQQGVPFSSAYKKFINFVNGDICYSHGWGGNVDDQCDGAIIAENLALYNLEDSSHLIYRNIAPLFAIMYQKHNINICSQSSGQIVKILGLQEKLSQLNIDEHNALFDVYSILEGLRYFNSIDSLDNLIFGGRKLF